MAESQLWSRWPWLVGALAIGAGLAVMPPLLAASWLLGLVALGLATCDPVWPVALAVLSVPFQQLVALPGGLSVTQFCFVLVALSLLRNAHQRWPRLGLPGIALAIFLWTLALAATLTPLSRSEGLKETLRWGTVLLIYMAAVWALQDPAHAPRRRAVLLMCLLVAPAITALIGIGQFLTGIGPASFAVDGGRVRAYGTIGQPNSFAGYLNQAWPLAVGMGLAVIETRRWQTYRFWLTLGAIILAGASLLGGLLASFSRGGWVGALIGAVVMGGALAVRYGRQMVLRMITATLIAGIGGLLLLYSGVLPAAFSNRISSIIENLRPFDARGVEITPDNFAVVERMAHLQAAWHMFQERPLVGVGPGNFSIAYERLAYSGQAPTWIKPWYDSRGHAHNYYLHIAAESGLIGAVAYGVFLVSVWYIAISAVRQASDWLSRGIALGGIGVIGALSGHNLFENLHVLNMGVQFGTVIALLTTITTKHASQLDKEDV
ncbi:MAG: O-antigen ligase family protein [Chloroflexus sp.]|nr:O-antigen ligase family protein [Chloroflexus sp.]